MREVYATELLYSTSMDKAKSMFKKEFVYPFRSLSQYETTNNKHPPRVQYARCARTSLVRAICPCVITFIAEPSRASEQWP